MGHAFKVLIPICLFSLLGYIITSALFGTGSSHSTIQEEVAESLFEEHINNGQEESWTLSGDYSRISLDVGAYSVKLSPTSGGDTTFTLSGTKAGDAEIDTYVDGETLNVEIENHNIDIVAFFERFAKAIETGEGWEELFGSETLVIGVPERIYDEVNLNLGSGNVTIDGVDALSNYFNIGSGAFTYNGTGVACEELYLNMGSGKAVMNNAACGSYSIEIGSGVFEIYGITGSGSFEMGSGSGTLGFSDVINYNSLEIGSGSLKVALPDNTSAEISADIGSGSVHVDACGQNTRLRDGNKITLGGGESENEISVDLASGSVRFTNDKPAATTAQTETAAFDEVSIVDTPAQTTVVTSSLAEIDPEEFIAAVDTLNAAA